jgi:hypothetical protein
VSNVNETKNPSRTSDAAPESDERDDRSSLERLADLTRRVLRISKAEISQTDRSR